MQLEDFLRLLHVESGPDGRGNYKCRCPMPTHTDHSASMSVGLGKNKKGQDIILVKCHKPGCGTAPDIVRAMGLTMKDLTCEDRPPWEGGDQKYTIRKAKALPPAKPQAIADLPPEKKEHGAKRLECAYSYKDENGNILYEALRYRYEDGKKTFRQRRPDPAHPGQYLYDMAGVRLVLYRLPEVMAAIREKKAIWVAEGEKDADNLAAIGLCGTSSPMGAGKWDKGNYADFLKNAEVYILPDNDDPGRSHARDIARSLESGEGKHRILDLKRIWPEIPEKGDVSDLIQHFGAEKAKEMLLALMDMPFTELQDMPALYSQIGGYHADYGYIAKYSNDGARQLCNFVAVPTRMISRDDGAEIKSVIEIKGWDCKGRKLPLVRVNAEDFSSMGWVGKHWALRASILPGTQTKDQLRYALAEAGRMVAKSETEYAHTGWRKIQGEWIYLHGSGAIGGKDIRSFLEGRLQCYGLGLAEKHSREKGFLIGQGICDLLRDEIGIPLISLCYLAPLNQALEQKGIPPSFALYLYGPTGSRKSTIAAMALSHFGKFDAKTPTASFRDTGNSAREKAFILKDSILWVDDYHPTEGAQEKKRMDAMAQDLARAFGDHAERGRLNADRTLQIARPPRGLCLMTGEDLPGIGASGLARFYIVDVHGKDVPIGPELTALQEAIRQGALQSAMAGYIEKLRQDYDALPDLLHDQFIRLREEAGKRMQGTAHGRSAESIAHLMLGWKMMLAYGRDLGLIDEEAMEGQIDRAWQAFTKESLLHAKEAQEDAPERKYLSCLSELLASRQCYVASLTEGLMPASSDKPGMIGWADKQYYMLLPEATYQAISILFQREGRSFPLSPRGIHRALKEKGLLFPEGDSPTRHKWVGNRSIRLLFIPRHLIDGTEPITERQGFIQVDEPFPE